MRHLQFAVVCVVASSVASGCASNQPAAQRDASQANQVATPTTAAAPSAATPTTPATPAHPAAPATAASKAPVVQPSWWNKPAPTIDGHETLIAQADASTAAAAKQAAIDAAKDKLAKLGADTAYMEVLNSTITKVRFDGPFRAFVLASAPKAK